MVATILPGSSPRSANLAPPGQTGSGVEQRPQVFAVPVFENWLIHAPVHGESALLTARGLERLRAGDSSATEIGELYHRLSQPAQPPLPLQGDPCPSFLGIIPTRGCNIGCVYCNFGGPTAEHEHMDPRIAVQAVDWTAAALKRHGQQRMRVHFFGGEPFVSGRVVDVVIHHTRMVCARLGLTPYFDVSTNGVMSDARCEFVGDYFDSVVLSFDGPPEFQDRNRPTYRGKPTSPAVHRTAKRLSALPVELCLRVCVTHESVGQMEAMTRWMIDEYRPKIVNFETLTESPLAQSAGLKVPDPYEFAQHYLGAARVAEQRGVKVVYSAAEVDVGPRLSFCPVGTDALIVALDGRASACYLLPEDWQRRGLDMDLGYVSPDFGMMLQASALEQARSVILHKPRCERCFCQWTCAGGCHVNHSYPGCPDDFDAFCIQTRLLTACLVLRELGFESIVDALLADRAALTRLGENPWDVLHLPEVTVA